MADENKPRVRVPKTAKKGEIFEVKTSVTHPMENGSRKDKDGNVVPRNIINKLVVKYNGKDVFGGDFGTAVSANPFLSFHLKAEESGKIDLTWTDESGAVFTTTETITVEG
ncbi:MAG: thiosulfate oxidation carrier complex protein SoxZ [Alphaproteobacteria bacterium]|nr:thiosulfate oxidation carrier complex protein SoxZ [Alphaproteobacteria bacterium]MBF0129031.1 thiosulfate oxidation carrier complex protein SoxZ [Alphaproteobacteria bacterium]